MQKDGQMDRQTAFQLYIVEDIKQQNIAGANNEVNFTCHEEKLTTNTL